MNSKEQTATLTPHITVQWVINDADTGKPIEMKFGDNVSLTDVQDTNIHGGPITEGDTVQLALDIRAGTADPLDLRVKITDIYKCDN